MTVKDVKRIQQKLARAVRAEEHAREAAMSEQAFALSAKADASGSLEDHENASYAHQQAARYYEAYKNKARQKKHTDQAWHHVHFVNRESSSAASGRRNRG